MTSDGTALLAEIVTNPEDDTVRLAFADWLEEQPGTTVPCPAPHIARDQLGIWMVGIADGEVDTCRVCNGTGEVTTAKRNRVRAELIRAQIERARLKPRPLVRSHVATSPPAATGGGLFTVIANFPPNTHPDLKIRDSVFDVAIAPSGPRGVGHRILGCAVKTFDVLSDGSWSVLFHATQEPCPVRARCDELEARIVQLNKETNHCPELGYTWVNEDYYGTTSALTFSDRAIAGNSRGQMHRGFVESVVCTAEEWLKIEGALVFHPDRLMNCPTCTGPEGWKRVPNGVCPVCPNGYFPIPCPLTAHPIRRVRLTTHTEWPVGEQTPEAVVSFANARNYPGLKPYVSIKGTRFFSNELWPGIEFELTTTDPVEGQNIIWNDAFAPLRHLLPGVPDRLARDAHYTPDEIDQVRRGGFQPANPGGDELAGAGPDS